MMAPNSALVTDACAAALSRLLQRGTTRTLERRRRL